MTQTRRRLRIPVLRLSGTLISLAMLGFLLYQQGWQEIVAAFLKISPWRLLLALGLMLVSRLAVTGRWYVLLRSAGIQISFVQSLKITFAGLFANNVLPTTIGGDVVRLGGTLRMGHDRAVCVASLVVDRLVGMAGMSMMLPFGLPAFLSGASPVAGGVTLAGAALPAAGLVDKLKDRANHVFKRLLQALGLWLKRPRSLLLALGLTWVHMLCLFTIFWLLLEGMGQNVPFWLVGGLESVSYFVTLLPVSINGLGLQELSIAVLFSKYGGASPESGLTLAILYRTLMLAASLPGVLFIPGMIEGKGTGSGEAGAAPQAASDAADGPSEVGRPAG